MESRHETNDPASGAGAVNAKLDIRALQEKWGVSEEEIRSAIEKVGNSQNEIEEYLVNNRWNKREIDEPPFQKRDLNEDETY
jgi:hypothetical protein